MNQHGKIRQLASLVLLVAAATIVGATGNVSGQRPPTADISSNEVLTWNELFVTTLIETRTPNSSSQRLGAIVHIAVFDAFNGIERRYAPIVVKGPSPAGASTRAAVVAAAHATLVALFPTRQAQLDAAYQTSVAALGGAPSDDAVQRGLSWGRKVAEAVLSRRANDGYERDYPAFVGGNATGQWRPTAPGFSSMSAQSIAFTEPFAVPSATQFQPPPPRSLDSNTYMNDLRSVAALGRATGSTRTAEQTALAPFWEGNATVHWNQAATQIAAANRMSLSDSNRLLATLNIAMADTAITIWSAKRKYGNDPTVVTWRPITAIAMTNATGHTGSAPEPWMPLVTTPSHPEYPAGHPALNGAAATVLLARFPDAQRFTLTTRLSGPDLPSRDYDSISRARADGNDARVWGGMHYPSTVAVSDAVGESIARYVNEQMTKPLR